MGERFFLRKFQNLSLQVKISSIYILANLLIFIVNIGLLIGIHKMSGELDMVYQKNLFLNELEESLQTVQDNMTNYLSAKTSDSLENYYRSVQVYTQLLDELSDDITGVSTGRMEHNIKHMSEQYLEQVAQTIEAKRGRNVEKYRVRYENATKLYQYIDTYITSLNREQFTYNSKNYSEISKDFRLLEAVSILIMGVILVGNIIIIIQLTGAIISPLSDLAKYANEVGEGNLNIELLKVRTEDEIGVVTKAFNQMVVSIREYIDQIQQRMEVEQKLRERELLMESHLKDAQLKYLRAQINPHFLFNTLNAGAQLAMMEAADRTYEYVQNVAEFFRYNIKKANEIVTLRDEIQLVDHYIYILNVRFSGEIHYDKKIDEKLLMAEMPGMVLQPIIENCVNHGIREMAGKGEILLRVYEVIQGVCIQISDNGIGMSQEQIASILNGNYQTSEKKSDSNGIAMDNVISRIRLFAGNEDAIDIESEGVGKGTKVFIYLPLPQKVDDV